MKKLAIMGALCLVLLLVMTGCGTPKDSKQTDLKMGVSALAALADNHVNDYLDVLQYLAARPEIQSMDWNQMKDILAVPLQSRINARIFFVLPDGTAFADQGKTEQSLADRDYFPKLMAGETVIGTVLVGKMSNIKSYLVAVPVKKDGKVVGGLGTTPYLDKMSQTLSQEMGLPDGRIFYALDSSGVVTLSSDIALLTAQNPVLSKNVVWQTSALTGWRFALGAP